jgi:hypothetical protein
VPLQLSAAKLLFFFDICKKMEKNLHISKSFCIFAGFLKRKNKNGATIYGIIIGIADDSGSVYADDQYHGNRVY